MIGNGQLKAIHTERLTYGDQYALALNYALRQMAGELPTVRIYEATVTIVADTADFLTITLKRKDQTGSALADITYVLSGAATGDTEWSGSAAAGYTANASTLKEAIDLLNLIPNLNAWALDAPHSQSVNLNDFVAMSATSIQNLIGKYTKCLQLDIDELAIEAQYKRIGNPDVRDAGAWKVIDISGVITSATAGYIRVYRDDIRNYEAGEKGQLLIGPIAMSTSSSGYIGDDVLNAAVYRGPLLIEVLATDTAGLDLAVKLQQAEL